MCLIVNTMRGRVVQFQRLGLASYSSKVSKFELRDPYTGRVRREWRVGEEERLKDTSPLTMIVPGITKHADFIRLASTPIDLRISKIKQWFAHRKYKEDVIYQTYDEAKNSVLGRDLSCGHFVYSHGGSVRFTGKPWMKNPEDKTKACPLPEDFEDGWELEAIDISHVPLVYEGFENFKSLNNVVMCIAQNSPNLDDWCLDVLTSGLLNLETLDISYCSKITANGLQSISRLRKLKTLEVGGIPQNASFKLTCLLLESSIPGLSVNGLNFQDVEDGENVTVTSGIDPV